MPSGESQIMAKKHAIEERRLRCEYQVIEAARALTALADGLEPPDDAYILAIRDCREAVHILQLVEKQAKEAEGAE